MKACLKMGRAPDEGGFFRAVPFSGGDQERIHKQGLAMRRLRRRLSRRTGQINAVWRKGRGRVCADPFRTGAENK